MLKLGMAGGVRDEVRLGNSRCRSGMMHLLRQRRALNWSELFLRRMDDLGDGLNMMRSIQSW